MAEVARQASMSPGSATKIESDLYKKEGGTSVPPSPLTRHTVEMLCKNSPRSIPQGKAVRDIFSRRTPCISTSLTSELEQLMGDKLIKRFGTLLCGALIGVAMISPSAHAQSTVRVIRELKHDVSQPLAELGKMTPAQPNRFSP